MINSKKKVRPEAITVAVDLMVSDDTQSVVEGSPNKLIKPLAA